MTFRIKMNWKLPFTFITYAILLTIIIAKHEPWFDEAQAWLLARDLSLHDLFVKFLRYEGSPGLWHLILMIPAKLNLGYCSINIIAGTFACVGVYVFLKYAPIPLFIKILYPFSFFTIYQCAVVARSYVLLPLLLFLIARIYHKKNEHVFYYVLLLSLLANVCLHGTLISISLMLIHVIDVYKVRHFLDKVVRLKQINALLIFLIVLLLMIIQLVPPYDLTFARGYNFSITHFFETSVKMINNSMTEILPLSILVIIIILWWLWQKKLVLVYLLPLFALLSLFSIKWKNPWHESILFFLLIFVMWISFESSNTRDTSNKNKLLISRKLISSTLILVLSIHIYWSVCAIKNDLTKKYSASKDVAKFIKDNQLENKKIYATRSHAVGILPY